MSQINEMLDLLRHWQGLERQGVETTAAIMEETDNLVIRLFMEIIRNDSVQHHRVQQFMIDLLTKSAPRLSWQELGEISEQIDKHNELEKETVRLATELREKCTDPVQKQLLTYLLTEEKKHVDMLANLDELKAHMSKLH